MKAKEPVSKILMFVALGFVAIIALSWIDELTPLQHMIGKPLDGPNWHEGLAETLIVLVVAIPVLVLIRRLLARLRYLEDFVVVCAWCKKVNYDGEWITMDAFFAQKFDTETSHGICIPCSDELRNEYKNQSLSK